MTTVTGVSFAILLALMVDGHALAAAAPCETLSSLALPNTSITLAQMGTDCSTGGRQALMEAQRYPEDFDGIIAGAPANNQTQLCAWRIAVEAKILQAPASVVPRAKLALVNRAVLASCDALDGVTDALLMDPHQCHFDPATLLCRGADNDSCLTAPQVEAVKVGYAPARRKTGELIYPGLVNQLT